MKKDLLPKVLVGALTVLIPAATSAQQATIAALQGVSTLPGPGCPETIDVRQLCHLVGDQLAEPDPETGEMTFAYRRMIRRASCAGKSASPEVVKARIQEFWRRNQPRLVCTQLGFSVNNGSILKLAVEMNAREFINDALRRWEVDLNHVDAADGRTVLDYIEAELARMKGTSLEPVLQRYFKLFRDRGAKFRRELER